VISDLLNKNALWGEKCKPRHAIIIIFRQTTVSRGFYKHIITIDPTHAGFLQISQSKLSKIRPSLRGEGEEEGVIVTNFARQLVLLLGILK
jgi:hypothetical protein